MESLEDLVLALAALHEQKPLGFQVSWAKTKVQLFGSLLNKTPESVHAFVEDVETLKSFIQFGSVVLSNCGSCQEILRQEDSDLNLQGAFAPCHAIWL